ncbi:UNVERIFIED_CONTAM: hypothetical protein HDU68_002468, partial [Siphonaria sp. JEL0065]
MVFAYESGELSRSLIILPSKPQPARWIPPARTQIISSFSIDPAGIPCDNYNAEVGILDIQSENPTFTWKPVDFNTTDEASSTNNTDCLHQEPTDNLDFLINAEYLPFHLQDKLVLTYSDSNDRNTMNSVCDLADGELYAFLNAGILVPLDSLLKGDTLLCVIRRIDHVLVWYSVFQYGAMTTNSWDGQHYTGQTDNTTIEYLTTRDRAPRIASSLSTLAKTFFPELCIKHGFQCTADPDILANPPSNNPPFNTPNITHLTKTRHVSLPLSPPSWYPPPDIIITQSALWDIFGLDPDPTRHVQIMNDFLPHWKQAMQTEIMDPLQQVFGGVIKNVVVERRESDSSSLFGTDTIGNRILHRWFLRTTPPPSPLDPTKPTRVNTLNEVYRTGGLLKNSRNEQESWGLIDWDAIVRGHALWQDDGFHLDEHGCRAYAQA